MKRVALFIGINPEGEILLQHKTANAPTNANLWVLFGGSLEEREDPREAIRREVKEELRIGVEPRFFKTYTHEESWGMVERNVFYGNVTESTEKLKTNLLEGDNVDFFPYDEMQSLPINKNHLAIVGELLKSEQFLANKLQQ